MLRLQRLLRYQKEPQPANFEAQNQLSQGFISRAGCNDVILIRDELSQGKPKGPMFHTAENAQVRLVQRMFGGSRSYGSCVHVVPRFAAHSEGQRDLETRIAMGISRVIIRVIGLINLLTESP